MDAASAIMGMLLGGGSGGSSGGVSKGYVDAQDAAVAAQIPHKTSDLTNDSGFADKSASAITSDISSSSIRLTDAANARVQDLIIYGKEGGVGASGLTVKTTGKNILAVKSGYPQYIGGGSGDDFTFTKQADGTYQINGSNTDASSSAYYSFVAHDDLSGLGLIEGTRYTLSGNTTAGTWWNMEWGFASNTGAFDYVDSGSGVTFEVPDMDEYPQAYIYIRFGPGFTANNLLFKPMVCSADISDTGFERYKDTHIDITTALPLRRVMKTVDLGDFDWVYQPDAVSNYEGVTFARFVTSTAVIDEFFPVPDYVTGSGNYALEAMTVSDRYTVSHAAGGNDPIIDKAITMSKQGNIFVTDSAYTDPAAFKAAVSGITLTYPSYCDEIDFAAGQAVTRVGTDGTALVTPVVTPLTNAELSAFRQFCTFEGITNIIADDEPHMTVRYINTTDNGKAVAKVQTDLQEQINALSVNTGAKIGYIATDDIYSNGEVVE